MLSRDRGVWRGHHPGAARGESGHENLETIGVILDHEDREAFEIRELRDHERTRKTYHGGATVTANNGERVRPCLREGWSSGPPEPQLGHAPRAVTRARLRCSSSGALP